MGALRPLSPGMSRSGRRGCRGGSGRGTRRDPRCWRRPSGGPRSRRRRRSSVPRWPITSRIGANRLPGPWSSSAPGVVAGVDPAGQRGETFGLGEQVGVGAANLAEQVCERRQRDDVAADGDATPDVEAHPGPLGCLRDQRRLPDPGIPADQQDRRDTGPGVSRRRARTGRAHRFFRRSRGSGGGRAQRAHHAAVDLRGPAQCALGPLTETVDPGSHPKEQSCTVVLSTKTSASPRRAIRTGGASSACSCSPCSSPRSTTRSSTSPCRRSS